MLKWLGAGVRRFTWLSHLEPLLNLVNVNGRVCPLKQRTLPFQMA